MALVSIAVVLVAQTGVALRLHTAGECTVGQAISGMNLCRDSFSFFGGVQGERLVMAIVAGVGIALSLARMVIFIWRLLRHVALEAHLGMSLREAVTLLLGHGGEARVWQQANRQRVRQAQACLHIVSLGVLPGIFLSSMVIFDPKAMGPQPDRGYVLQYLFNSTGPPLILVAVIGAVVDAVPSSATPTTLNCINIFFSIVWAWKYTVMSAGWYAFNNAWILAARAIQGIVCGNARLTILLNAIVTGVEIASVGVHMTGSRRSWMMLRDVFVFFVISILSWTFEQHQLAEARALLRSLRSDRAAQLVHRLLSGMCEAVVRLDGQLRIMEPSPGLSLLLRPQRTLQGLHFTDLMPAEDAERMKVRLEDEAKEQAMADMDKVNEEDRSSKDHTPAQVQHLHLNSGSGSKLPAELFYSCLLDVDGQPSFLVGIKADTEVKPLPEERVDAIPESKPHQESEQDRFAALPEDDSRMDCQSSSRSLLGGGSALQVCLDAATPALRVLKMSSSLALLGGAAGQCSNLQDWLSAEDTGRLSAWLAVAEPSTGTSSCGCTVKLQPPNCMWSYRVSCMVRKPPESLAHVGSKPVCMLLEPRMMELRHSSMAESDAVERVVSTAPHWQAQGDGGASGSAMSAASGGIERDDWILLWFTVCSRRLRILEIAGASSPYHDKFAKNKNFRDWLERPREFVQTLKHALAEHELGFCTGLPRMLGSFGLTQPGSAVDRCAFTAKAFLVAISDDEASGYPCCLGLQPLPEPAPPCLGGRALEEHGRLAVSL